jgi:hypothetical protein
LSSSWNVEISTSYTMTVQAIGSLSEAFSQIEAFFFLPLLFHPSISLFRSSPFLISVISVFLFFSVFVVLLFYLFPLNFCFVSQRSFVCCPFVLNSQYTMENACVNAKQIAEVIKQKTTAGSQSHCWSRRKQSLRMDE